MVRTRFAPSPTGYLHIGGVRTALFNWLFARQHGGQFVLRIDDTDAERNVQEALQPILDGFRWLGLDWDEGPEKRGPDGEEGGPYGPYYQSQKLDRYQAAVRQLLDKGLAYWDYATKDELKADREAAEREKRPYVYKGKWRADTAADRARFEAEGRAGVVRLAMPSSGVCQFRDHIRGVMEIDWSTEPDHVIQRENGTVLYNLASVVDDHDMKISHVIRAEEHLSNTPRQIFIAQGLGYPLPEYAHLPFVAEPGSKNKLSKRKIAQYLKNPDFKKVYELGFQTEALAVADAIRKVVDTIRKEVRVDTIRKEVRVDIQLNELPKWLAESPSPQKDLWESTILGLMNEAVAECYSNREYLESYRYGQKVREALPTKLPPEMFNPVIVDFYCQVGYLQDAILNYLVLLGWSLDDKTEFFTRDEMIRLFSLERVNKSPASFDAKKLSAFQEHYMQKLPIKEKVAKCLPYLRKAELVPEPVPADAMAKVTEIVRAASERIKVFGDVLDYREFFVADDRFPYDESAFDKRLRKPAEVAGLLARFRGHLATATAFDASSLEALMNDFVQAEGIGLGQIVNAVRVAVTGKGVGFGLYETLAILGREHSIARIERALARMGQGG